MKQKFFSFLFITLIFSGCFGTRQISSENLSSIYHQSDHIFHPEFSIYNFTTDSSHLYVKLNINELLFVRQEDNLFKARLRLDCRLIDSYESTMTLDSSRADFVIDQSSNPNKTRLYIANFKVPKQGNFLLFCSVIDLNKKVSEDYFINVNHDSKQSRQNFLVTEADNGVPLLRNYISADDTFRIKYHDPEINKIFVRYYHRNFPLASPPFSFDAHSNFNYVPDSSFTIDTHDSTPINFPKEGMYHFQIDTSSFDGFTLFRFKGDFPSVTTPEQMIEATRYLTSKKEFEEINNSASRKAAVDKFWLDIGGNQERTRLLIKKYYSRIQEANRLFSSYTEGWRTDRGMMYIIMGPPNFVYKNSTSENWIYGQPNNAMSLNLFFPKVNNPFTDNDFSLSRAPIYESTWYRSVDLWRNGRVYNDF